MYVQNNTFLTLNDTKSDKNVPSVKFIPQERVTGFYLFNKLMEFIIYKSLLMKQVKGLIYYLQRSLNSQRNT